MQYCYTVWEVSCWEYIKRKKNFLLYHFCKLFRFVWRTKRAKKTGLTAVIGWKIKAVLKVFEHWAHTTVYLRQKCSFEVVSSNRKLPNLLNFFFQLEQNKSIANLKAKLFPSNVVNLYSLVEPIFLRRSDLVFLFCRFYSSSKCHKTQKRPFKNTAHSARF